MDRPTPRAGQNTRPADIPRRPKVWQPNPIHRDALDRHIRIAYGEDVAEEYGIPRRRRRQ
jgi:hypothetical protein